jgi:hypothetical protein
MLVLGSEDDDVLLLDHEVGRLDQVVVRWE